MRTHWLPNRLLLRGLFLTGLALALWLGHPVQLLSTESAAAQSQPTQLVQDGVTAYRTGNYAQAIDLWTEALALYPEEDHADRAMVYENLARTYQHIGETQTAISSWEAAGEHYQTSDNSQRFGRTLTEQAQVYISLGQQQRAAALLCGDTPEILGNSVNCPGGAYAIAETTNDMTGQAAALGSLAETYRLRGNYETAKSILDLGLAIVQSQDELAQYRAPMLNSSGNTYARWWRLNQQRAEAAEKLSTGESVAKRLNAEAAVLETKAREAFASAIDVAIGQNNPAAEMRSHLSLLALDRDLTTGTPSQTRLAQLISQLPASRETAYAAVTLAKSYRPRSQDFGCDNEAQVNPQVKTWLETGLQIAKRINDDRAKSFALGELGHLAECQRDWDEAIKRTNQAQWAASDALESTDSLYLWEWQMGRIYKEKELIYEKQGETDQATASYKQAIAFYKQAIDTLEDIRTSILTANRDLQFDFRDTVEPIYRQYIALQLPEPPDSKSKFVSDSPISKEVSQTDGDYQKRDSINQTLKTIDSLRLAELQNFFGDNCVLEASADAREQLLVDDPYTAIITSVVLEDQTALIVDFPKGENGLKSNEDENVLKENNNRSEIVWIEDDTKTLRTLVDKFRDGLPNYTFLNEYDTSLAEQLYRKLILPIEPRLESTNTQTLVFIQDGFLRNIPMSALHDGNHYLVEKYAIATTPSLGLTAPSSRHRDLKALAVGSDLGGFIESDRRPFGEPDSVIEGDRRFFAKLDSVDDELAAIADLLAGSKTLLNREFTIENFQTALQEDQFSILHLATHGQFSTIPEETFVITGPDENDVVEKITFEQLETLISKGSFNNEPLDLITLTACQTAKGDDRATLGLAGVAIQAGARSAIASLWNVDDKATETLITQFYSYLRDPSVSKAKALQLAQIDAISANPKAYPGRWAPFVLVGNWQ